MPPHPQQKGRREEGRGPGKGNLQLCLGAGGAAGIPSSKSKDLVPQHRAYSPSSRVGHLSSPRQDVARQSAGVLQPPWGHCGPSMMLVMMLAEG